MSKAIRWTQLQIDEWVKRRVARHADASFDREMAEVTRIGKPAAHPTPRKYGNEPTADGSDSKAESRRLSELRLMNEAGQIMGLSRQVEFVLLPKQVRECGELIERKLTYIADFAYHELTKDGWRYVVEDTKGFRTQGFVMKKKLMLAIHGIEIRET